MKGFFTSSKSAPKKTLRVVVLICIVFFTAAVLLTVLTQCGNEDLSAGLYSGLIDYYEGKSSEGFPRPPSGSDGVETLDGTEFRISELWNEYAEKGTAGYTLTDLNADGNYELITTVDSSEKETVGLIMDMYVISGGKIKQIWASDRSNKWYLLDDGRIAWKLAVDKFLRYDLLKINEDGSGTERLGFISTGVFSNDSCVETVVIQDKNAKNGVRIEQRDISESEFRQKTNEIENKKQKIEVNPFKND